MKKIILTIAFFTCLQSFSQDIDWQTDIDSAIMYGKENNKDVFIYLGEKKCVPCRTVQKYAYDTKKFQDFSKKFVMVKVYNDLDKSKKEALAYFNKAKKRFNTKMVPRFILIRNEKEIANFFAYVKSPEDLIDKITPYLKK